MSGENSTFVENNSSLPEDLLRLLVHPSPFSDAVLKCDGVEIPVHKCILSARSPVFSAMFGSEMQEGQSGKVNIVDIELKVLQIMLKYLYSGKIDILTDTIAEDLLFAADKYGLKDLKRICVDKLKSSLSVDNVIRILILGDLHDMHLKARAIEFICKCDFSYFEGKKDWESLQEEYPKLAMEVMKSIVKHVQDSSKRRNEKPPDLPMDPGYQYYDLINPNYGQRITARKKRFIIYDTKTGLPDPYQM